MIKYLDLKRINDMHDAELRQAVGRVFDSGWYLTGEATRLFEQHYAEYIGTRHCIGCGNGLDALTLILRGYMELGVMAPGDEVIVPATTFIASILAITDCGLRPVLVDASPDTLQIDDSLIEAAITGRTRALMIVHLYGRNAYTDKIGALCKKYNLKLVEDNAQAHGCKHTDGSITGSIGDAAGHSFYPGKNLGALGDGGAVTTNDKVLADTVRTLANYGSSKKYVFKYTGRNSRMDEIQAAVLDVKLRHLDEDNDARRIIADIYYKGIKNPLVTLPARLEDAQNVYHLFPLFCEYRDELQEHLKQQGVQTLIHYPIPPHKQECYSQWNQLSLPVTEKIHSRELSLPISPVMTADEAHEVVRVINAFRKNA